MLNPIHKIKSNLINFLLLLLLISTIILGIILVNQKQVFKGRAALSNCPNKFIMGLNGPVDDKIKQLFTTPSLSFIPIGWKDFQPTEGAGFDFTETDRRIDWAITNGQTPTIKFCDGDCFPDWARQMDQPIDSGYCCSSEYVCRVLKDDAYIVNAFKQAVEAMASRYKDKVHYWDYGIEPNCRGYNPARYTRWLRSFNEAVKSQDPNAAVIGGHLAGANTDYLRSMYENGAQPYFDRIAIDPYGQYGQPLDYTGIENLRALMEQHQDGNKLIWVGEWGIDSAYGEQQQANLIGQGLDYLASKSWIEAAFYHNFECDIGVTNCSPGGSGYIGFGLLRGDGTEKLSFEIFKQHIDACVEPTNTPTPSLTPPPTLTPTPFITLTSIPTTTPLPSQTLTTTITPSRTLTPTRTPTPSPIVKLDQGPTETLTRIPTPTPTYILSINFTPTPTLLPGSAGYSPSPTSVSVKYDLNTDGKVNSFDAAIFISYWRQRTGSNIVKIDFNGDKVINSADYSKLLVNWN